MIPMSSFAEHSTHKEGFHEGTIQWLSRCNMVGSTITVRVVDSDMNQDSEKIEQFDIKVWSDNDVNSDYENRILYCN